jgi:hypothetical protein
MRRSILSTKGASMNNSKLHAVVLSLFLSLLAAVVAAHAQAKLSTRWEELTAADFVEAIQRSQGTCLLPFGILEKHGAHLPLGTDLVNVRYLSLTAAAQEYAVVFPEYYFGQIFEAKHQPGTIAYSRERSPTACRSNYSFCRKPQTRWHATGARKS